MAFKSNPHSRKFLPLITFLIGAYLIIPSGANAAGTFTTPIEGKIALIDGIEFLEDPKGNISINQITSENQIWEEIKSEVFNRGYSDSVWWLRFNIENPHKSGNWLMEIAYPVIDFIDVYQISNRKGSKRFLLGDKHPFEQRPILHRNFLVPIDLTQSESTTIYIRVKSTSAVQVPLNLWDLQSFYEQDISNNLIEGIYFGGLLIIALYNLFMFSVLRDRVYIYYVANVFFVLMFFMCLHGWSYQYFWPHASQWNDTSILVFLSLLLMSSYAFSGRLLDVPNLSKTYNRIHYGALSFCAFLTLFAFLAPYKFAIKATILFSVISCIWGFVTGFAALKKGNSSAQYYLLAWSMFLTGSIVMALNKFHILPRNTITDSAIQIGSLLDVLFFSFALADRINAERALRIHAQQDALDIQRQANEELETRVEQRTRDLEYANQKLQELSDTDQLTQLKNRRYLDKFIGQEFDRAHRQKKSIAILLVDIDHFKSVNDTFGHLLGDECLKAVAQRINSLVRRPADLVARYGGEEFCLVLPDTTSEGAFIVAENIRKAIEKKPIVVIDQEIKLTASIGVKAAIPLNRADALRFIALADNALYDAKSKGRNCVVQNLSSVIAE